MMKTILRTIAALTGFSALGLQFWLMVGDTSPLGLIGSTIEFFSYFTMLINTSAAFAMFLPLTASTSGAGRFLSKPSVRTATAGYMIIVAVVYFLFLRNIGDDQGWERFADQLMHYATPILFMIDWLTFVPKGQVHWTMIGTSLVVPIVYGIWTMVHGALTGWYPYPFFDLTKLGYPKTLANFTGFIGAFIAVALALVVIDRMIGSLQRHADRT
jgi:hypothetical protein